MHQKEDFRKILHTPKELGDAHYKYAKEIIETDGLDWPVPCMNKDTLPLRPGKVATITGRPGHGKSTILGLMGKYHAQKIADNGNALDEAVVHVTWEQSVEELEAFYQADGQYTVSDIAWGRVPLETIKKRADMRQFLPVWMIGLSVTKRHKNLPRMTLETVLQTIELMEENYSVRPKLLLFDYVQIIPVARAKDRMQQVTEVAPRVKEVAGRVGVPAFIAVQAARAVDERDNKVPQKRDCQWASSIEQMADTMFGIWRPSITEPKGSSVSLNGKQIPVTENLLVLKRLKQRGENAVNQWILHFDPATLDLRQMDLHHAPPQY